MSLELVRTTFTYVIALVVILGAGALLVIPTRIEGAALLPFVTGVTGVVLGFVFSDRSASQGSARTITALRIPPPNGMGASDGTDVPPA